MLNIWYLCLNRKDRDKFELSSKKSNDGANRRDLPCVYWYWAPVCGNCRPLIVSHTDLTEAILWGAVFGSTHESHIKHFEKPILIRSLHLVDEDFERTK